jgi:hypothetical protein
MTEAEATPGPAPTEEATESPDRASPSLTGDTARALIAALHAEALRRARGERFAFAVLKWMYLVVFLVAAGAMVAAVRIATDVPATGYEWSQAGIAMVLGVASVGLFALLLFSKPLVALERHNVVQAYLTVVLSSYWTRVLAAQQRTGGGDLDGQVEAAAAYAAEGLAALLDRQYLHGARYLGLVEWAREE